MHLLVLSAFRRKTIREYVKHVRSQCTFWCSVLSDRLLLFVSVADSRSQCTFWCSVLSDGLGVRLWDGRYVVSMHLLVLSAFRLGRGGARGAVLPGSQCTFWCSVLSDVALGGHTDAAQPGLNAPFGAQCFPTLHYDSYEGTLRLGLNAPFGAQCFPT